MLTSAEIALLIVRLEDDPSQRVALSRGFSLFEAAVDQDLVPRTDISTFAVAVGQAVGDGLVGYRSEQGGAILGPGLWSSNHLQSRFDYFSTVEGQQAATLLAERQRAVARVADEPSSTESAVGNTKSGDLTGDLINFVFALPQAAELELTPLELNDDDKRTLRRYLTQTRHLLESAALTTPNTGYSINFSFDPDDFDVETNFPTGDAAAGLAALFRHVYSSQEPASFANAMAVLQRTLRADQSADNARQLEILAAYGSADGRLRSHWLRKLAWDKGVAEQMVDDIPGGPGGLIPEESPDQVISLYLYGEHLHLGRHVERVEALAADPLSDAQYRMAFLSAVGALAKVYAAFAAVVETALDQAP